MENLEPKPLQNQIVRGLVLFSSPLCHHKVAPGQEKNDFEAKRGAGGPKHILWVRAQDTPQPKGGCSDTGESR